MLWHKPLQVLLHTLRMSVDRIPVPRIPSVPEYQEIHISPFFQLLLLGKLLSRPLPVQVVLLRFLRIL